MTDKLQPKYDPTIGKTVHPVIDPVTGNVTWVPENMLITEGMHPNKGIIRPYVPAAPETVANRRATLKERYASGKISNAISLKAANAARKKYGLSEKARAAQSKRVKKQYATGVRDVKNMAAKVSKAQLSKADGVDGSRPRHQSANMGVVDNNPEPKEPPG